MNDCGAAPAPGCGAPARWSDSTRPVVVCAQAGELPPGVEAVRLQDAAFAAAAAWNSGDAAVGIRYAGLCESGTSWEFGNGRNEIGFDDRRRVVPQGAAAITASYLTSTDGGITPSRAITEADVVLSARAAVHNECLRAALLHEFGHLLGFGHSDDPADAMYPNFSVLNPANCRQQPSPAERAQLRELYGANGHPWVLAIDQVVPPGELVTLNALALDPEGDPLTFTWEQIDGPRIAHSAIGGAATFTAPGTAGIVRMRVVVRDQYLHETAATLEVVVGMPR